MDTTDKCPRCNEPHQYYGRIPICSCNRESMECTIMSSSSLEKELNTPEEDEAWADFQT